MRRNRKSAAFCGGGELGCYFFLLPRDLPFLTFILSKLGETWTPKIPVTTSWALPVTGFFGLFRGPTLNLGWTDLRKQHHNRKVSAIPKSERLRACHFFNRHFIDLRYCVRRIPKFAAFMVLGCYFFNVPRDLPFLTFTLSKLGETWTPKIPVTTLWALPVTRF